MSRIARDSVNGRLNRNTCYSAEVASVQCKRGLHKRHQMQVLKKQKKLARSLISAKKVDKAWLHARYCNLI